MSLEISVVIPALNEADFVAEAVASARAPGTQVIVVDGGSSDATRERARAAGARVVVSEAGRARQLARGVEESRGEVLVFLHADTRLPPRYTEHIARALSDPAAVGGAFAFRFAESGAALRWVEWGARLRGAWLRFPYGDQALFVWRSVLTAAGGVPQVPLLEDLDLVRALRRRGRFVLCAAPAVTSARRYLERGILRSMLWNWIALFAWSAGLPRARIAAWYRR